MSSEGEINHFVSGIIGVWTEKLKAAYHSVLQEI